MRLTRKGDESQSVPQDDNLRLQPTINVYFRHWPGLRPSENSNQSHMVSYCSAIKHYFIKLEKTTTRQFIGHIGYNLKWLE